VIRKLENQPQILPDINHLKKPEIQAAIIKAVEEQRQPEQLELEGVTEKRTLRPSLQKQWNWLQRNPSASRAFSLREGGSEVRL